MKITVFGLAGSGTSTIGKLLAEKLEYEFMSSGNIMRQWAEELWHTIYEFEDKVIKQDQSFDIKLDEKVRKYGQENVSFVFESRLAWHFIPDSFKVYLYCEENERYNRIHKREGWELAEIIDKTSKRESELIERYKAVYPHVSFPPEESQFDMFVDGTEKTPDEIVSAILSKVYSYYQSI